MGKHPPTKHPQRDDTKPPVEWEQLLRQALTEPGIISAAYSAFWDYSTGNQILALIQCKQREIQPGPIDTFAGWLAKGRQVRRGEKAIVLCRPITRRKPGRPATPEEEAEPEVYTSFVYKPLWFVLSQTDGEPFTPPAVPGWELDTALANLQITREEFGMPDGNALGYAYKRTIAISPLSPNPLRTAAHELGHILLGHTAGQEETEQARPPRNIREVSAEAVAILVLDSLGFETPAESRGYMQNWYAEKTIPGDLAREIAKAAHAIIKAGRPA